MAEVQLANLVEMESPKAVLDEVLLIVDRFFTRADPVAIQSAFNQTVSLYRGKWPHFRACNTDYHDLKHVTDCFLAMARLLHGAVETGAVFSSRQIHQGLVAALLHDTGYLQHAEDRQGTGAKYTDCHVRRGMDFIGRHHASFGLRAEEIKDCQAMVLCTDINRDPALESFADKTVEQLGKTLATADIMSQMADRTYLEKLLFLYHELDEARVPLFKDEVDLLIHSKAFCIRMADRFENQLSCANRFMIHHFKARWAIDADLYQQAIEKQQDYLAMVLADAGKDPRDRLRRRRIAAVGKEKHS